MGSAACTEANISLLISINTTKLCVYNNNKSGNLEKSMCKSSVFTTGKQIKYRTDQQ